MKARRPIILACSIACLFSAAAHGSNFDITGSSSSAQSLSGGQTGTVESTGNLSVSSGVGITVAGSSGTQITITNNGTISDSADRAIRDNTGKGTVIINNNAGATITTSDADDMQFNKDGTTVTLNNSGQIISLNASAGGSQAVDFNAITSTANIINNFSGGLLKANEADAVRPGVNGQVNNSGTILSVTTAGSSSDGVDAQANTGVVVMNSGLIEGGRHGITGGQSAAGVNFTTSVTNNVGGVIQGDNGSGINLDGADAHQTATVINHGSIIGNGVTGDGDGIDVDGVINLTNTGTIRSKNAVGAGAASEGITVGGGTITNSGTIEGLVATGNTSVTGRGITLAGNDNAAKPDGKDAIHANTTITNQAGGKIRGQSDSGIAQDGGASAFTVTINNNAGATIEGGGTTAAVRLSGDNHALNNSGSIIADSSNKAVDLGGSNNTMTVSGGTASIQGDISGGTGTNNVLNLDPGAGNLFAYSGSASNFSSMNVKSGTVRLSGVSTFINSVKISGSGRLELTDANRLSSPTHLQLSGGTLFSAASIANGQTFAGLTLDGNSTIDLNNSTSISFGGLDSVTAGDTLSIINYDAASSPDYAIRFSGDLTGNSSFLNLIADTTIDGSQAIFRFDGTNTDVFTAVPEPATLLMGLGLIGFLAARRMRVTKEALA